MPCSPVHSEALWVQYQEALQARASQDLVSSKLDAFISKWLESEELFVLPPPMISSSSDRYGYLKPCLA